MKWINNKSISVRDVVLFLLGALTVIFLIAVIIALMRLAWAIFKVCFSCLLLFGIIYLAYRFICKKKQDGK